MLFPVTAFIALKSTFAALWAASTTGAAATGVAASGTAAATGTGAVLTGVVIGGAIVGGGLYALNKKLQEVYAAANRAEENARHLEKLAEEARKENLRLQEAVNQAEMAASKAEQQRIFAQEAAAQESEKAEKLGVRSAKLEMHNELLAAEACASVIRAEELVQRIKMAEELVEREKEKASKALYCAEQAERNAHNAEEAAKKGREVEDQLRIEIQKLKEQVATIEEMSSQQNILWGASENSAREMLLECEAAKAAFQETKEKFVEQCDLIAAMAEEVQALVDANERLREAIQPGVNRAGDLLVNARTNSALLFSGSNTPVNVVQAMAGSSLRL